MSYHKYLAAPPAYAGQAWGLGLGDSQRGKGAKISLEPIRSGDISTWGRYLTSPFSISVITVIPRKKRHLITIFDVTLRFLQPVSRLIRSRLVRKVYHIIPRRSQLPAPVGRIVHVQYPCIALAHPHPVLSLLPNPHKAHWPAQEEMKTRVIATMNLGTTDTPLSTPRSCRIPFQAPSISPQDEDRCIRLCLCGSSTGLRQLLWTTR